MGQSFESLLIEKASKDTFKKAKALLHSGELVFCTGIGEGRIRAIFRDPKGIISRVEVKGFPDGPYSSVCTCNGTPNSFCRHAVAACLQYAKFTIKPRQEHAEDKPALYAGLQFTELGDLLKQVLVRTEGQLTLHAESEFPHMPSKWERTVFHVTLQSEGRSYTGNQNNLRQLLFDKRLSVTLNLETFPQQDRQIIRYLAINAEADGGDLTLNAEQTAEFFHCLGGFPRFFCMNEKVTVHDQAARLALLVEDSSREDTCILRTAIMPEENILPLSEVKIITGRSGCWVGMLGEYWWIPAAADVLWTRNFLRTTVQICSRQTAEMLLAAQDLPFHVVENRKFKVSRKKFKPFLDAKLRCDGTLETELLFNYGGVLCTADQEHFSSRNGFCFLRDAEGEEKCLNELTGAGFEKLRSSSPDHRKTRLLLRDKEAIRMLAEEMIPGWINSGRQFSLSSDLAALCTDENSLKVRCRITGQTDEYFDLKIELYTGSAKVRWKELTEAALKGERTLLAGGALFVKIPEALGRLALGMADAMRSVPSSASEDEEGETLRLLRPAVYHWVTLAEGIPGAIPNEFLRMKLDLSASLEELSENFSLPPEGLFHGELRNYQIYGVRWLSVMGQRSCNVVLADEMGLGKTIQTLGLLTLAADKNLPALVIAPTSLIENWAREAERFTPALKVLVIAGASRGPLWRKALNYDLIITSYSLIRRDGEHFRDLHFRYLVLDEAQHIKNPATANARACKTVQADRKIVLTGTPLENSPEDLWSIFDFLHPGLLGTLSSFRKRYTADASPALRQELAKRMVPFMLRRKKADVQMELPPKQEQVLCCCMENAQRKFYDSFLAESRDLLSQVRKQQNSAGRFEVLTSLLRLRQICCAPELLPEELRPENCPGSAKLELLKEMLLEAADSGHKVLLFSQFTSLLKLVREWLEKEKIPCEYLDGTTSDRMKHVDHFNEDPEIPVFLLSLKAGGVGLNLTAADTVIIYDPWWNPAAETQAEDRSHRIGQTRPVNCMKLVVKDSIEEKVLQLQQKKAGLFRDLVESPAELMKTMSDEDIEFLLQ